MDRKSFETGLLKATTAEEVKALFAEAGLDCPDEQAQQILEKSKLSPDELESLSGGNRGLLGYCNSYHTRDRGLWGCAATVEDGSDCWGTDGGCNTFNIAYY